MRTRLASLLLAGIFLGAGFLWSTNRGPSPDGNAAPESPAPAASPTSEPSPSRTIAARPPSPSSTPSPSPTPPPAAPPREEALEHAALRAALEDLLVDPGTGPDSVLGVVVLDASGATVLDAGGDEPLLPASTQKLVTAAGALAQLGPEHRFTTTAEAAGSIDADGTLAGDLILVGGGDPVLASPVFAAQVEPNRPHTPLAALADRIVAAGVRRVTGRVVGDATVFAEEHMPAGWDPGYLSSLNGVRTAGLTVDAGRSLGVRDGRVTASPSDKPALQAAVQLQILLVERGVAIDGGAGTGAASGTTTELGRIDSPPLRDLLAHLVKTSDNQLADGIFRSVGAAGGDPTWTGSAAAIRDTLAPLRLDWSGTMVADGSGLSREDRLSAGFLARLDLEMSRSELANEWERLMAVSGEPGTLRRRLVGTVAEGRVRGKTGTLRDVRSIAAAVTGPEDARYHFAVVGNRLTGDGPTAVRSLQDEIALLLVEDLYGCVRVEVPATGSAAEPPSPPPVELQCAA